MNHLTPFLTGAALALCLGAVPMTLVHADEPKTDVDPPVAAEPETETEAESKTIQWIEGWEAGKAAGAESGKLMLVYVHRTSPP